MGLADCLIFAMGLAAISGLGLWTARGVCGLDDFLLAGRRFGTSSLTLFHAGSPMQKASSITARMFQVGLAGLWYEFIYLASLPFWWVIGPVVRRLRLLTTADLFERRFHPATVWLYVAFALVGCVLNVTVWLVGLRKLIELMANDAFGWQGMLAVIMGVSLLCAWAGGFRAVVVTGIAQTVLMLLLTGAGLWLVFGQGVGVAALHGANEPLAAQRPELLSLAVSEQLYSMMGRTPLTALYVAMMAVSAVAGSIVSSVAASTYGCARSEGATAWGTVAGNLGKRLCVVAWAFLGLAWVARYVSPGVLAGLAADPTGEQAKLFADRLFARASHDLTLGLGAGAAGLLWVGLAWGAIGGCAAPLVAAGGLVSRNLYQRFLRPGQSEKHYLHVARWTALACAVPALLLAFRFDNLIKLIEILIALPAAIGLAVWLALGWRRYTTWALLVSTFGAYVVWVFLEWQGGAGMVHRLLPGAVTVIEGKYEVADGWIILTYLSVALVLGIATSLVTRPERREKLDAFYRLLRTPAEGHEPPDPGPDRAPILEPRPIRKLIDHPDLEIPVPSPRVVAGFTATACAGAGIVLLTWWLAQG